MDGLEAKTESRRKQMTKLLIRTALIELMQEKPFERITIKELCECADVNRTTFYLHYADQRAVLNDVKEDAKQKTVSIMQGSGLSHDIPDSVIRFLNYVRENDKLFRILFMNDEGDRFRYMMIEAVTKELAPHFPSSGDPQRDAFGAAFILSGSMSIIIEWMRSDYLMPVQELADYLFAITRSVRW